MNNLSRSVLGLIVAVGLTASANAVMISYGASTLGAADALLSGTDTSQAAINSIIFPYFDGVCDDVLELYKQDVDDPEEPLPFAGSYTTTFSNSASDPEDALVHYDGGASIGGECIFMLVKGGGPPGITAWYLFNISDWNGTDNLVLTDFWLGPGAISHITLYAGGEVRVPDGSSTVLLLGLGLSALAIASRRKK